MKNFDSGITVLGCFGALVVVVGAFFFAPILGLAIGWFTGVIIKMFAGAYFVNGLNLVFNTTRFTVDAIPMITATLAVVGSFFRSSFSTQKNS